MTTQELRCRHGEILHVHGVGDRGTLYYAHPDGRGCDPTTPTCLTCGGTGTILQWVEAPFRGADKPGYAKPMGRLACPDCNPAIAYGSQEKL